MGGIERAAEILKQTGVDKTLKQEVAGSLTSGRKRGKAFLLGLVAIAVGVALLFFSVQLATRVTVLASPALGNQTGTNATNQAQTYQYVQYGIWTIGVGLIAYGTNRIRRG